MPISFPVHIITRKVETNPKKRIFYPEIIGMRDVEFQYEINKQIVEAVQALIDKQIGKMPGRVEELLGTYEIKNNQRQILSLTLSNYIYFYHAAHGMTYISSLTFDLEKKRKIALQDLFKKNSNYKERISQIIREQIKQRNITVFEDFKGISDDQEFYLADKTLVIYFQLYEMAPYAFGFPMFPISLYDLADIIDENGPAGRLMENN